MLDQTMRRSNYSPAEIDLVSATAGAIHGWINLTRLLVYSVWALIWTTSGAMLMLLVPPALAAPPPATGLYTEAVLSVEEPWCAAGCVGLAEWRELADQPALVQGLALLYHFNPEMRPIAQTAVARRTRLTARPLPVGGHYDLTTNVITLNAEALRDGPATVAALAAHELFHAASSSSRLDSREGAADCLEEELHAYAWQSVVWLKVRPARNRSALGRELDLIAEAWRTKRLKERFFSWPAYERVCLGRELPSY
ncbi:MAG: hypothetical protein HY329_01395 [Chloroflexi bacterium]|nr:hypothetical protein [Chloroflexota bacterium]